ncbi:MAG: hypothetical protein K2Y02_04770 [Burkholderiaceae bacterium]|nr:hypothetical protein [Burkholderiaceae bacterium]
MLIGNFDFRMKNPFKFTGGSALSYLRNNFGQSGTLKNQSVGEGSFLAVSSTPVGYRRGQMVDLAPPTSRCDSPVTSRSPTLRAASMVPLP